MAISSFVLIEPAPFDLLGICLAVTFFTMGMQVPKELATPLLLWSFYIIFTLFASVMSLDPIITIKPVAIRIFLIIIWLFITCLIYENPQRYLPIALQGYTIAAVIAGTIGVLAYYGAIPGSDLFLDYGRAKGTYKDPNVFAPSLVPAFILCFSRIESGEGKSFVIPVAVMGIISLALLLGFSRGAWVNLVMSLTIYLAIRLYTIRYSGELTRLTIIAILAILAAVFLMGWLITTSEISGLFENRAKLVQSYDTHQRFEAQRVALGHILESPFGIGPGQFGQISPALPHNVYLFILSESGWMAGLAYISFVILTVWKGFIFCLKRTELQLTALVIFSCVLSTQLQSFLIDSTHWRHLYILYALMWGVMLYRPSTPEGYDPGVYNEHYDPAYNQYNDR